MKTIPLIFAFSLCASGVGLAAETSSIGAPAAAHNSVCITASDIRQTTVVDDRTILFTMYNNKIWKNTLPRVCTGLKFENGFAEDIRGNSICSNLQIITVLRTKTPCSLGAFTAYTPPPKSASE